VCGVPLPAGLTEGSRLPEAVFTPATKAPRGEHDENIPAAAVAELVGADAAADIERITLAVYARGAELAARRGIIVADTKIELGFDADGTLLLADEVLTPDSSRFWPADQWQPGRSQPSLDKQYVRDWLTSPESGWDRHAGEPPPPLPEPIVERTRDRYVRAYESITGLRWG
jgi:phosphoribosylaminoimidazole-succinocarboxamide synthase